MSLYERITNPKYPCNKCKHLRSLNKNYFCLKKDKIILKDYPPNKCKEREENDRA